MEICRKCCFCGPEITSSMISIDDIFSFADDGIICATLNSMSGEIL